MTGVPQHEVSGGLFDFADLAPPSLLRRLGRIVSRRGSGGLDPRMMEQALEEMAPKGDLGPWWLADLNRNLLGRPGVDVAGLAREVGVSVRQLERLSGRYIGVSPKKLTRIHRLRRCLRRGVEGCGWSEAALEAGYADQAHLSRECRAIHGLPPTALARLWQQGGVFRL